MGQQYRERMDNPEDTGELHISAFENPAQVSTARPDIEATLGFSTRLGWNLRSHSWPGSETSRGLDTGRFRVQATCMRWCWSRRACSAKASSYAAIAIWQHVARHLRPR